MAYPRLLVTALALGACNTAAPVDLPMDIVVTDGRVEIYLEGADLGGCECNETRFPAPGTCSIVSDVNPCGESCDSCITDLGVELDGKRLAPKRRSSPDPWSFEYEPFASGSLAVVIEGCGHPKTRFSIDGPAFPSTTVTANYVNGKQHVQWTSDASTDLGSLLSFTNIYGRLCHVAGTDYTDDYGGNLDVEVNPFVSRTELDTELGHATIWRGGRASASFPLRP